MLLALPAAQAQERFISNGNIYVELDTSEDGAFVAHPRELTLKVGERYRLELMNFSRDQRHVLMAPEFEDAISTTGIRTIPGRVEMAGASLGRGIDLPPGTRVEIYFQAQKEGRYKLFCEDRGHTTAGMDVAINVKR
jgi:uncharacterized cupredoxin-like copper-binding protein